MIRAAAGHKRPNASRRVRNARTSRHPRQAGFLSLDALRWVVTHRAWNWRSLVLYWRLLKLRIRQPHIVMTGFVALGRNVQVSCDPRFGRMVLGRWVHIGDDSLIRCNEGSLTIGDNCVFGFRTTIVAFLDVWIGPRTLAADTTYIMDFDHRFERIDVPIMDQGVVKSPVRLEGDTWIGSKVTILRGTKVGKGAVLAAHALVRDDVPPLAVVAGVPARQVATRATAQPAPPASSEVLPTVIVYDDETYVGAERARVACALADQARWLRLWPGLDASLSADRGDEGFAVTLDGRLHGWADVYLEALPDGTVVHFSMAADPVADAVSTHRGRPRPRKSERIAADCRSAFKQAVFEIKAELEQGC